ncbi:MAG: YhcH/YjgK/YiaL family protein [Spirochaetaceae bacterium]
MIYDKIENTDQYLGLSNNLDIALNYMKDMDFNKLKPGKYEIDGDKVFVMLFEYETKDSIDCVYESHKNYIDIQLLVEGDELFRVLPFNNQEIKEEYNKDNDIEFFKLSEGYNFHLKNGYFVLVMPGELHTPALLYNQKSMVKKLVFKIRVNDEN